MIRVRVDWHRKCARCETVLVVDYFDESSGAAACPWCGSRTSLREQPANGLRDYLRRAASELESQANDSLQRA